MLHASAAASCLPRGGLRALAGAPDDSQSDCSQTAQDPPWGIHDCASIDADMCVCPALASRPFA
eukprot:5182440-Pyramimonas_sp.AAC.1